MITSSRRAIVGALVSLAAAGALAPRPARAADLIKVRAAARPILDTANFYVALNQRFFTAEGLDVSVAPEYTGTVGLTGAIIGSHDIAYTNIPSVLVDDPAGDQPALHLDSERNGAVGGHGADRAQGRGPARSQGFCGRDDRDQRAQKLAVDGHPRVEQGGRYRSRNRDAARRAVPLMLHALKTNQVDGIFAIERSSRPIFRIRPRGGRPPFRLDSPSASGRDRRLPQKNPDTVRKFYASLVKGAQWINANRSSPVFYKIVAGYTKLDPTRIAVMGIPPVQADINVGDLRRLAQLMRDTGLLTSTADPAKNVFLVK